MTTIRVFFPKLGHFFPIFEKGQGRLPPPPSSYTPKGAGCLSMYDFLLPPHMNVLSNIIFLKKTRPHVAYYVCIVNVL